MKDFKCLGCGEWIHWVQINGKWNPTNINGTSHFDTCPEANKFRGQHNQSRDYEQEEQEQIRQNGQTQMGDFENETQ